jgi:hypothetical protein
MCASWVASLRIPRTRDAIGQLAPQELLCPTHQAPHLSSPICASVWCCGRSGALPGGSPVPGLVRVAQRYDISQSVNRASSCPSSLKKSGPGAGQIESKESYSDRRKRRETSRKEVAFFYSTAALFALKDPAKLSNFLWHLGSPFSPIQGLPPQIN